MITVIPESPLIRAFMLADSESKNERAVPKDSGTLPSRAGKFILEGI
jgi:hypothetical protein